MGELFACFGKIAQSAGNQTRVIMNRGFRRADGKHPADGAAGIFELACFQAGPGISVEFLAIARVAMFGRELECTILMKIVIRVEAGHLGMIVISSIALAFVETLDAFVTARRLCAAVLRLMQISEGHESFMLLSCGEDFLKDGCRLGLTMECGEDVAVHESETLMIRA